MRTKTLYEVIGWKNAENPQRPDTQSTWSRKTDAMQIANTLRKSVYKIVEVNKLAVTPWDETDIHGCELIASWTNGKKTA